MARKRTTVRIATGTTRRTFTLSERVSRRLGAYSAMHGITESAAVERALVSLMRGFTVTMASVDVADAPACEPDAA